MASLTNSPTQSRIDAVIDRIRRRNPAWEQIYTDPFYENILEAGFNSATVEQAFGLAQIVENIGPITLRGAFYRAVSEGLFPDTDDAHYRCAGNIVLKLRRSKCISYSKIVDSTRRRLKPPSWSGLSSFTESMRSWYRTDLWARQDAYIEVFVEKDAMAGVLYPITEEYDVPLNVIRGDVSETFVFNTAEIWKQIQKPIFAYYLGDHDPSGLRIEQTLIKKLLNYSGRGETVFWKRIAIDDDDFNDQTILGFPIKGDRNSRAWQTKHREYLDHHGDRCVEIDAIHPDSIRERLRQHIESHIDQVEWEKLKAVEAAERDTIEQFVLAQKAGGAE